MVCGNGTFEICHLQNCSKTTPKRNISVPFTQKWINLFAEVPKITNYDHARRSRVTCGHQHNNNGSNETIRFGIDLLRNSVVKRELLHWEKRSEMTPECPISIRFTPKCTSWFPKKWKKTNYTHARCRKLMSGHQSDAMVEVSTYLAHRLWWISVVVISKTALKQHLNASFSHLLENELNYL